ncbi:MAG: hypothetical protein J6T96_05265 [Bacteroidales bacterium]|nr:hypothetical protein [Bacteroidales bacterium]
MTKIIEKVEVEKTKYIANDGTEFENEIECRTYENKFRDAERKAKFEKIFGKPMCSPAADWIHGPCNWYDVTITSIDELIDFLTLVKSYECNSDWFDNNFVDRVTAKLNNGEKYNMLVEIDDCYYISIYSHGFEDKMAYERYMSKFESALELLEKMKQFVTYTEPETENTK